MTMCGERLKPLVALPERLRLLADWFDDRDRIAGNPDDEVQADLRRWASEVEQLKTRLALAEEVCQIVRDEALDSMKWPDCIVALHAWLNVCEADEAKETPNDG